MRALVLLIAVTEILGFAGWVVVPTIARDILGIGAGGFGIITAARAIGAVALLIVLARVRVARTPALFVGAMGAFGIGQIAFGLNTSPALAVALSFAIGGAAACCDALGQTLLQQVVPDTSRGAAMGVWFFSLGFGPIGFVAIGALAEIIGASMALVVTGIALVAVSGARRGAQPGAPPRPDRRSPPRGLTSGGRGRPRSSAWRRHGALGRDGGTGSPTRYLSERYSACSDTSGPGTTARTGYQG